jgi:hypothetical protein
MDTLLPGHIRLLHIEAGYDEQPLYCRLVSASLTCSPSYEALSYTWGTTEKDSPITCGGLQLFITQNLHEALRYLRQPDRERVMWADALCINQDNDSERTEQVLMMREIYANASHVVIWLGKDTREDKVAFSMLNRFQEMFSKYGQIDYGTIENIKYSLGFPDSNSEEWSALVKLFQRPWFQRIWAIQEAVMARQATVACGSLTVGWDLIVQVARAVRKNGVMGAYEIEGHAPGLYSAVVIGNLRLARERQPIESWKLLNLLRLTRNYQATDLRDKIFALIGIITDIDEVGLGVDYSKSIEKVYGALAIHSLVVQKTLVGLSNAGVCSSPGIPKLPSWVPDWSHNNDRRFNLATGERFRAAGDSQPTLSISADEKILVIRGFVVDTLTHVSIGHRKVDDINCNATLKTEQAKKCLTLKRSMENGDAMLKSAFRFPEGQTCDDALWRTLCCDLTPLGKRLTEDYRIGYQYFRMWIDATGEDGIIDPAKLDKDFIGKNIAETMPYLHGAQIFSIGRCLCVTAGGYMGRVPYGSAVGDVICILLGGNVPFVIRECGEGCFRLIGECYIHGIMDGEAMKQQGIESLSRDFKIC